MRIDKWELINEDWALYHRQIVDASYMMSPGSCHMFWEICLLNSNALEICFIPVKYESSWWGIKTTLHCDSIWCESDMLTTFPQCNFSMKFYSVKIIHMLSLTECVRGIPKECIVGYSLTCPIEHNGQWQWNAIKGSVTMVWPEKIKKLQLYHWW